MHRVRTGLQWRCLPERFGPWKRVCERHRLWSADGTWERLLQQAQAAADAAGDIDWDVAVDSTVVRAHQHAAGARTDSPPRGGGDRSGEHQDGMPWQSLVVRPVEVVQEVRAWAASCATASVTLPVGTGTRSPMSSSRSAGHRPRELNAFDITFDGRLSGVRR